MTETELFFEKWVQFFYNKIKVYIPYLIKEMKGYNLTKTQSKTILKEVFDRAIEDIDKQFT